jgi:myo-inositol-1(or 4)-monophosphatase
VTGTAGDTATEEFVVGLCRNAGQMGLERFGENLEVSLKGEVDLVTDVDLVLDRLIRSTISGKFPEHSVMSEEEWREGAPKPAGYVWLVDPLDGTTNYVHGYPAFCVSVALVRANEILTGCIYDPLREELFYAEKGSGATLNGRAISVSAIDELISSLLSTGFPYERASLPENNVSHLGRVLNHIQGVRRSGSLALDLAYVACGRLDGHWELYVKPWDTAAGGLLITEAGGRISRMGGEPWTPFETDIVATNGRIHDQLLAALREDRE